MEDSIELSSGKQQREKEAQKYKKVRVLGQGSMGRAYLVECIEDSKLYVMKRINIGHLGPKQKQNALREAQLHSLFTHPNIIQLKEVYQTTGQKICIVMQYAQGGDLQEFIQSQEGKFIKEQIVLSMFVQICLGLQEIHAKRIIHRDIKTANIFLTSENLLKIGDFGISKTFDKTQLAATALVGTPYYLSPEMVEGKPYSTKADIWALGVMLYQLCSLKLPFQANSLPVLALKILKGSFPPVPNQYSKDIKTLILQMLQVDQKKRPTLQTILLKPFIFKILSKEEQSRQTLRQQQKKQVVKQKQKKQQQKLDKTQKVQKMTEKQKQQKVKARKQREDKRQEMRTQMRDDLKKKRGEKDQESQPQKVESTSLVMPSNNQAKYNSIKYLKKQSPQTPKQEVSTKGIKKQDPIKPWKNKKIGQKKDVTIQMFVPQLKPKTLAKKEQSLPPGQDFKAKFASKNSKQNPDTLSNQQNKKQGRKSAPLIQAPIQNYHFSQNKIKTELQQMQQKDSQNEFDQQFQEQDNQCDMQDILDNVKIVEELAKNLPNPSRSICLYEESQNFDSTVPAKFQPRPTDIDNLKQLLNSESLEELRLILEERMGDSKFMSAYSVVKQHLDTYYQMLAKNYQEVQRQVLKEKYVFNKQLLRQKLQFLSESQFQKNIELLFTLIMYQDLQMQKNQKEDFNPRESKYSRLI